MKESRSRGIWNLISLIVLALMAGALVRVLWQVWKLNVLPEQYFMILCAGMAVVTLLLCLLMFTGKKAKKVWSGKRVTGYLFSILILAACFLGSTALQQVQSTFSTITNPESAKVVLGVYVRIEDPAQSLQDTAGYTFAVPENLASEELSPVLEELEQLLGGQPETISCPGITAQMDALFSGEADAVILDTAYLTVLDGLDDYTDYADRIRLLHEKILEKEPYQPNIDLPQVDEESDYSGFLVYISGRDSWYGVLADGRSDVNILAAVNSETHQILLVNTPRDYYVVNPASGNGSMDKLTHCSIRGIENSMEALSILYGHMPKYYARINFSGFQTLVDAIGGVTVYSDRSFSALGTYIYKGENHLNGQQALNFARERKNLRGGDNDRGKNQLRLIEGIINQLTAENLLNNYTQILQSLEGMFATSIPADLIGELVQVQISEMSDWEILSFAVTGDNGTDHCWAAGAYAYVMYPHENMVEHASGLIEKVLVGEVLTQEDLSVEP